MTQVEKATEYPISKLQFLSPAAVSPRFERNNILSPFTTTVLRGKYFQSMTAKKQWKLNFFYRLACSSENGSKEKYSCLKQKISDQRGK